LAKASEQFRQSDVTLWGIVALVCAGLAVFGANVSALLPQGVINGLHQPRVAGASLDTLRLQMAALRAEAQRLDRESNQLASRFTMQEQAAGDVTRRVGALEMTVPKLVEALPDSALIDRTNLTASIESGDNAALVFDADGGSVVVRQSALPQLSGPSAASQPLPAAVDSDVVASVPQPASYGVAIGVSVPASDVAARWNDLSGKLGPLLFGLTPLMVDDADGSEKRIVVGPISEIDAARALCERLEQVSIACMPMPYLGRAMENPLVDASEGG